jgi:hypothetical protein
MAQLIHRKAALYVDKSRVLGKSTIYRQENRVRLILCSKLTPSVILISREKKLRISLSGGTCPLSRRSGMISINIVLHSARRSKWKTKGELASSPVLSRYW